jgi:twitching motility protein PilT
MTSHSDESLPPLGQELLDSVASSAVGSGPMDAALRSLLTQVAHANASDLHLVAGEVPIWRVDGDLVRLAGESAWTDADVYRAVRTIMPRGLQEAFPRTLEADFSVSLDADSRFRVNVYHQRTGIAAEFRSLEELQRPGMIAQFCDLARGLVLVTGPTGSGKSTTLAAMVNRINQSRAEHILTIEDPIEYVYKSERSLINQREVGRDTRSFPEALKRALREDPDVILVGELRDLETIRTALTAAETGHLVFSTLHTQDAVQTVDRVIDVFPAHQQGQIRFQLASTLKGVVSQTLLKRVAGGRVAACEIMSASPAVQNMIREGKTHQIYSALQSSGGSLHQMMTLDQHLADLVDGGLITAESALEVAHDEQSLQRLLREHSSAF